MYFLKIFRQYEPLIHILDTGRVNLMIILTVSVLNHDTFGDIETTNVPDISLNGNNVVYYENFIYQKCSQHLASLLNDKRINLFDGARSLYKEST